MPTNIRRCLYIGLGGTGMNALLHTKKMFVDTYGEVPPMVAFLGIDTDGGAYNKSLPSKYGTVRLEPNEQLPIQVEQPRPVYDSNVEHLEWFPKECLYALQRMTDGAGQIRSNGRFALWFNASMVKNKMLQSWGDVHDADIVENPKYKLLPGKTEIHMVFSLCGGTGCGTFINMAYLIRKHLIPTGNAKLIGYGVLPDVFEAMNPSAMPNVKPNAYGAIEDLDWLMQLDMNAKPIHVDNLNDPYDTNVPPFDAFMLVDNKNANGDTLNDIDQVCEMISLSLVTASGELASAQASTVDNVAKEIMAGDMDVLDKRAWASGLGVAEIKFDGDRLHSLYSLKAAQALARKLLTSQKDVNNLVNTWIDTPDVNIRENNGQDNVIDFILSKSVRYPLASIEDLENPSLESREWIRAVAEEASDVKRYVDRVRELSDRVQAQVDALVAQYINEDGGVQLTKDILETVNGQIEVFLSEMTTEQTTINDRMKPLEAQLAGAENALRTYKKPFFGKNLTEDKVSDVIAAATALAVNKREAVRRTAAISFYNGLTGYVNKYLQRINNLIQSLQGLTRALGVEVAKLENSMTGNALTFQIDLTGEYVSQVVVNIDNLLVKDFAQSVDVMGRKGSILDLDECNLNELRNIFVRFTSNNGDAKQWGQMTIEDVLTQMYENKPEEVERIVRMAIEKSSPLLDYSYQTHGYIPRKEAQQFFYIGVPDKANSLLFNKGLVANQLSTLVKPEFISIGSPNTIVFYRQVGVIPPFVITPMASYKDKYNDPRRRVNCHYDSVVEARMRQENFSIYPKQKDDDTMELWVKSLILGYVRNNNGTYQYIDEENGDPLNDYWVPLASGEDRAQAFKEFRKVARTEVHDMLAQRINDKRNQMGDDSFKQLIKEVKENYLTKFVLNANITRETLKSRGYEEHRKLMEDEIAYVRKEL